jgi:hypothetical protein
MTDPVINTYNRLTQNLANQQRKASQRTLEEIQQTSTKFINQVEEMKAKEELEETKNESAATKKALKSFIAKDQATLTVIQRLAEKWGKNSNVNPDVIKKEIIETIEKEKEKIEQNQKSELEKQAEQKLIKIEFHLKNQKIFK